MPRPQDTTGRGRWLRLLGLSAFGLLAGCGWFSSDSPVGKARPGADREVTASGALPPADAAHPYDQGIAASPEARPQIGSIVSASGGQKAQREAAEKEAAERDAAAREAREKREAEEREAKSKEPPELVKPIESHGLPGMPTAAVRGNAESGTTPVSTTFGGAKPAPGTPQPDAAGGTAAPGATQPAAGGNTAPGSAQPAASTAPPPAPVDSKPIPPPAGPAPASQQPAAPPRT